MYKKFQLHNYVKVFLIAETLLRSSWMGKVLGVIFETTKISDFLKIVSNTSNNTPNTLIERIGVINENLQNKKKIIIY
jgi:hypothetical protein